MTGLAGPNPSLHDRILVRGVNWLGDAVMSTPALLRLREAYPRATLALLTPAKLADLWTAHPAIDLVIPFAPRESVFSVGNRLRKHDFQLGLVLPNSLRSSLEFWWARIPSRVGYAGQLRRWTLTRAVAPRPGAVRMHKRSRSEIIRLTRRQDSQRQRPTSLEGAAAHHIHQYLHLAGAVGASPVAIPPQLFVPENEVHAALQRFNVPPSPDRPLFALNAGAEYGPAKRWPMDRFVAAAREISSRTSCRWLVLGGKADQPLTEELCRQLSANPSGTQCQKPLEPITINLAGRTTLRELCAVLKGARLLVTNDTGPMHVAAALGIPVIVPFGSTSPVLTGPGLPGDSRHQLLQSTVPCAPCFLRECPIDFRCMHSIQVEQVIEAVMRTWQAP